MYYFLMFIVSGACVVAAGSLLARFGDAIGEHTGLGRLWIGSILLAAATSLPEIMTDISAVQLGAIDLAVGDLLGSSMANMLILAIIDLIPRRGRVLRQAAFDHALSACLAITLTAMVALFILAPLRVSVLGVGLEPLLLVAVYGAGMRVVFRNTVRNRLSGPGEEETSRPPPGPMLPGLRRALAGFGGASLVILIAAPMFARAAKGVAEVTGLGTTFVGTWLVGLATSLPELVSSLAAVRMKAFDLAVGNLLGSNALNMTIFLALDTTYTGGPLFSVLSPVHALTALLAILLMGMGLAAIVYRAEQRFLMIEPDSLLIVLTYVLGMWMLFERTVGG